MVSNGYSIIYYVSDAYVSFWAIKLIIFILCHHFLVTWERNPHNILPMGNGDLRYESLPYELSQGT
jgi:hypothetical protein